MRTIKDLLYLMRPWQWYKNTVVILALVFSGNLLTTNMYAPLFWSFLTLCAVSSANYIINDLVDRNEDKRNPEKKNRPLASGRVKPATAIILIIALLVVGIGGAFLLSPLLAAMHATLFALTLLYTLVLKHEAFADILVIAVNFVIRAIVGAIAIQVIISSWLIIGTFFFALFLATGKRTSEAAMLKEEASKHRKNLVRYTPQIASFLMIISTTLLIISYTLYALIARNNPGLIISLPFMLYAVLRYFSLVEHGSPIARHPHLIVGDWKTVLGGLLFVAVTFIGLYI